MELVHLILLKLSFKDLTSCQLTCKLFQSYIQDPSFRQKYYLPLEYSDNKLKFICECSRINDIEIYPLIEYLSITYPNNYYEFSIILSEYLTYENYKIYACIMKNYYLIEINTKLSLIYPPEYISLAHAMYKFNNFNSIDIFNTTLGSYYDDDSKLQIFDDTCFELINLKLDYDFIINFRSKYSLKISYYYVKNIMTNTLRTGDINYVKDVFSKINHKPINDSIIDAYKLGINEFTYEYFDQVVESLRYKYTDIYDVYVCRYKFGEPNNLYQYLQQKIGLCI